MLSLPIWVFVIICIFAVIGVAVAFWLIIDFIIYLAYEKKYNRLPRD